MSTAPLVFDPPGPGAWTLDTAHFPQPATRFVAELFSQPARRGFEEATARYGLLLDHIAWAFVHRWAYLCPRPVWSLDEERTRLTRQDWDELLAGSTALRARLTASAAVFPERRWRADVEDWDQRVKPELRGGHLALQSVEPTTLDSADLCAHLDRCSENLRNAIYQHHRLNVAPVIPAGDFLVHAADWAGATPEEAVRLLVVHGSLSPGAEQELSRLVEAIRFEGGVALDGEPDAVLAALLARPGPVGAAARDYLGLVGDRTVGSGADISDPCLRELPAVVLHPVRAALEGADDARGADAGDDALRSEVAPERRETFDALLVEARATHRVRDERTTYCDVWAYGLVRRGVLAAGERLAADGLLADPGDALEAGAAELRSLLASGGGPSSDELAERARYRREANESSVPVVLGGPPRVPIPVEWLPSGAARTERAFRTYVAAMSAELAPSEDALVVRGVGASRGTFEGRARVVRVAGELVRVRQGDVLVTASTTPAFNVVLPLVGAVVTDRGGLLSHAAIVAREFGVPAVVGTGDASARIPDGALVRVDGNTGEVAVTSRNS